MHFNFNLILQTCLVSQSLMRLNKSFLASVIGFKNG